MGETFLLVIIATNDYSFLQIKLFLLHSLFYLQTVTTEFTVIKI